MAYKVLIVLDGTYRFAEPHDTQDFTYIALVGALTDAGVLVTKAHRETDVTADIQNFNFNSSVNLLDFDVLWMIGNRGRNITGTSGTFNLDPPQLAAIARFMEAGGGVFATGDHDSIGADMCGSIPRVRAMRCWYGSGDPVSPMPASFPRNFPALGTGRADTTQKNPGGDYDLDNNGTDDGFIWFENQSDPIPQPITPVSSPAHPILRKDGADIVVYPDHMHEGNTLGEVMGFDYTQVLPINGANFTEFPSVAGVRAMPEVIATGQVRQQSSKHVFDTAGFLDPAQADPKAVNTLSVYDGRNSGVGRIVTGSTFHHYIDINLTGDSNVNSPTIDALTGPGAEKGQGYGFPGAETTFADIKAIYNNIVAWLARPRPVLHLILERSTFSQDEATANPDFDAAIFVTVDGLKPGQFPGGGITTLSPTPAQLLAWAPVLTPEDPTGLTLTPTAVSSDDPTLPDRLQRITFTYRVTAGAAAFTAFGTTFRILRVDASLTSAAVSAPLTDFAWIELIKAGNPFMLDLDGGNTTTWLSSDVRVFPVVAGQNFLGHTLANNATRADALAWLDTVLGTISTGDFTGLDPTEPGSALSPLPTTTSSHKNVYNFAIARVRLSEHSAAANNVRVFFRIFTSQTTAALTYTESAGVPIEGYKKTAGADPVALPGTNGAGTEWLSFPMFDHVRGSPQSDPNNTKTTISPTPGSEHSTFFGALIDNNLDDLYLTQTPSGGPMQSLRDLMMNEHQCIVAQIEYPGAPIPSGANPATSDKLAQRNLAFSTIANPGLDASRMAMTTFEIEATPHAISADILPDELKIDWPDGVLDGTEVRIIIPGWKAADVIALADRIYARHELRAIDAETIVLPGGGTRYVPLPRSDRRQTGILIADFPLGVKKGQRYDVVVEQVTTRSRPIDTPQPRAEKISLAEAEKLIREHTGTKKRDTKAAGVPHRGVYTLSPTRVLVTDLRLLDMSGDHAVIVEHPDPVKVAAARRTAGQWRQTIGAFQLGIPVSVKADMLLYHTRILSSLRWRAEHLSRNSRWYTTFRRYVDLLAEKVKALGGDPYSIPATPGGDWPGLYGGKDDPGTDGPGGTLNPPGLPGYGDGPKAHPGHEATGKISGLEFDHFGDFEGFWLETFDGVQHRYFSRERHIEALAREAWLERYVVTVFLNATTGTVRQVVFRGYR